MTTGSESANIDYPGDRCCQVYEDSGFGGGWLLSCLSDGFTEGYVDVVDYGFNDKMSSWWCGKDIAYDFCNDNPGDDCRNGHGSSGAGSQRAPSVGGSNDKLTTLYLYEYSQADRAAVTVFEDAGCQGKAGRLYATSDPTSKAYFSTSDLEYNNIRNDEMSSIAVPFGYSIDLYQDNGFLGDELSKDGLLWNDAYTKEMACIDLSGSF